jgi:hypothetical protein
VNFKEDKNVEEKNTNEEVKLQLEGAAKDTAEKK